MRALTLATAVLTAGLWACAPEADDELEVETEPGIEAEGEPVTDAEPTADVGGYDEYDADRNQTLNRDEFGGWSSGRWEGDADGWSREEFGGRVVTMWDTDDDDLVDEEEWRTGVGTLYGAEDYGVWADWDMDGDSELDANEVAEALESRNLYDRVDLDHDALIDDEELADWFFDLFDVNDDNEVDTTEWDSAMTSGYYDSW